MLKKNNKLKFLIYSLKKSSGRNNIGKITVRHKGGGKKKLYRKVDYKNLDLKLKGIIIGWDKSFYNSGWLSIIKYMNGCYKYVLGGDSLNLYSSIQTNLKKKNNIVGIRTFIKNIKIGTLVYNIESKPFNGGIYSRSAGVFSKIISINNKIYLLLPSKKKKKINKYCLATIGRVSNKYHYLNKFYKAGQNRINNIRPTVSGNAMNIVDHPNGGKGRGGKKPKTPWGKVIKK